MLQDTRLRIDYATMRYAIVSLMRHCRHWRGQAGLFCRHAWHIATLIRH